MNVEENKRNCHTGVSRFAAREPYRFSQSHGLSIHALELWRTGTDTDAVKLDGHQSSNHVRPEELRRTMADRVSNGSCFVQHARSSLSSRWRQSPEMQLRKGEGRNAPADTGWCSPGSLFCQCDRSRTTGEKRDSMAMRAAVTRPCRCTLCRCNPGAAQYRRDRGNSERMFLDARQSSLWIVVWRAWPR